MPNTAARVGFQLSDDEVNAVTGYCAAEMAFQDANEEGRLPFPLTLVPIIDHRTENIAREAAHAFVQDKQAVGILGPLSSSMAVATQDIYHKAGLCQLSSEASSPSLTERGYKNFRRLVANDKYQGKALAQTAMHIVGARRIAILHDDSAWGRPIAEIFNSELASNGVDSTLFYGFREKEKALKFDRLIQATIESKPDLVYFAVYWNKAHIIAHKLRYAGLQAVFLGSDALKPYAFLEVPSLDPQPPYHSLAGIDMRLKPSARMFLKSFAQKYPTMLAAPQYAAEAYDCASLMITAIERAGVVDRAKVLNELQDIESFSGAIGHIEFDENGDLLNPEIGLYQCIDGQRRYLGSVVNLIGETK